MKEELIFWKEARNKIIKQYGKPCKQVDIHCAGCQAYIALSWINGHIDLIEWEMKNN